MVLQLFLSSDGKVRKIVKTEKLASLALLLPLSNRHYFEVLILKFPKTFLYYL